MTHPIRKAEIHTFKRADTQDIGTQWLGRFYPYSTYPVFFSGATEQEVIDAAEGMRAEAIEKYEAQCIVREARRVARKDALAKKRAAKTTGAA